jgi:AraC family transcriptional regulator
MGLYLAMHMAGGISLMKDFPDFNAVGFDMDRYNQRFREGNVIIHARSADVAYPSHWGCLSIKCAYGGNEYYEANNTIYAVNNDGFLILNEGQTYSSYIYSESPVESFTINFSDLFVRTLQVSLLAQVDHMLADPGYAAGGQIEFMERLYKHDNRVSPVLSRLYELSFALSPDEQAIAEAYYLLLERMLSLQGRVHEEMQRVRAAKESTRRELYKRLHYAKDYIESCYMNNISLPELAGVACLNAAYFLRQFKRYFGVTPYQYLIQKRLRVAKQLLETTDRPVADICYSVGYADASSFIKLFKSHYGVTPGVA